LFEDGRLWKSNWSHGTCVVMFPLNDCKNESITNDSFGDFKLGKYTSLDKIYNNLNFVSLCGFHLNPFGYIINSKKDKRLSKEKGNGPIKSIL